MKITIIVPNYNSEKYILKCVESVIKQTYVNWELIIVDDGSTDNSYEICKKYTENDSRIFVYKQKNNGVSSARNIGLAKASGDYIMFLDSDDYIDKDTLKKCVEKVQKYDADIVKFNFKKEFSRVKLKNPPFFKEDILIEKPFMPIIECIFTTDNYCSSCECLIRSEIIKQIKFDERIKVGEDFLFFIDALTNSRKIYVINECLYHYRMHKKSVTNNLDYIRNIEYIKGLFRVVNKNYNLIHERLGIITNPTIKLERNIFDYYKFAYQIDGEMGVNKLQELIIQDKELVKCIEEYNINLHLLKNISFFNKFKLIVKKYIKRII